jgi:uncharacterized protein (DUF433 family)
MSRLQDRITVDPAICHGKPVIRGLRYPVEMILELLSSGMTVDQIIADYEDLEHEGVLAAIEFTRQSNDRPA